MTQLLPLQMVVYRSEEQTEVRPAGVTLTLFLSNALSAAHDDVIVFVFLTRSLTTHPHSRLCFKLPVREAYKIAQMWLEVIQEMQHMIKEEDEVLVSSTWALAVEYIRLRWNMSDTGSV